MPDFVGQLAKPSTRGGGTDEWEGADLVGEAGHAQRHAVRAEQHSDVPHPLVQRL